MIHALEPEWTALWHRVPDATPFTHPAWLIPWWRQFGTGTPHIVTRREQGRLVALLPTYWLDGRALPIGAGTTDYTDWLAEPGQDPSALDLPQPLELLEVPPTSPLRRLPGTWTTASVCPALSLPPTLDAFHAALPPRTLRKLRMNRNRATRAGGVTIETATPATASAALEDLIRLHQSRWTAQGEPGTLADPLVLAWHRESVPLLAQAGLLRLQVLRVDNVPAAAIYALLARPGRLLFYMSGFDAAFADLSPGTLLLAAMLEAAIAEGRTEADFLRGSEAYKYTWGATDRPNAHCRID